MFSAIGPSTTRPPQRRTYTRRMATHGDALVVPSTTRPPKRRTYSRTTVGRQFTASLQQPVPLKEGRTPTVNASASWRASLQQPVPLKGGRTKPHGYRFIAAISSFNNPSPQRRTYTRCLKDCSDKISLQQPVPSKEDVPRGNKQVRCVARPSTTRPPQRRTYAHIRVTSRDVRRPSTTRPLKGGRTRGVAFPTQRLGRFNNPSPSKEDVAAARR